MSSELDCTAEYSLMGILTNPKPIEPFQIDLIAIINLNTTTITKK
jgi:hypothetical protein